MVDILHFPVSEIVVVIKIIRMVPKDCALQGFLRFMDVFVTGHHSDITSPVLR